MHTTVKVEDAIGQPLAHDITRISRNEFKGRAFKKGHIIREEDIALLQQLGKRHVYVLDIPEGYLHENDAALALAEAFCGSGLKCQDEPREGKINLVADRDGLFKVAVEALTRVNMLPDIMCASRRENFLVKAGDVVAATRAIPLTIRKNVVNEAVDIARRQSGIFEVTPLRSPRAGILITGNEIYHRLIDDQFGPVLEEKLSPFGAEIIGPIFAPDASPAIAEGIQSLVRQGADLILTTGGMSVDPDDVTRTGVQQAGARIEHYGAPVLPGSMFMIAYIRDLPILGVPACGLYHQTTILDLLLPRVLAGERFSREDIAVMGHGGLCLNCDECRFPVCPFGK